MNFDFSTEEKELQAQVRRFLESHTPLKVNRALLETQETHDKPLWQGLAALGALGVIIPENFGGSALGPLALCGITQEIGRACAAVPFSSSAILFTQAIVNYGTSEQQRALLPLLASGEVIGTFAKTAPNCHATNGKVNGILHSACDGGAADYLITVIDNELMLIDLRQAACVKTLTHSIDPARKPAKLVFNQAHFTRLGEANDGLSAQEKGEKLIQQAAVFMAFEQVGGAEAALEQARTYALTRKAFGRLIGSYQAIKHKLTDMYIALDIARSNAYYAAMMLQDDSAELGLAASVARVCANKAYVLASEESLQTHGGIGFTWEADTQFHYRRAQFLTLALGGSLQWREKIMAELEKRNS